MWCKLIEYETVFVYEIQYTLMWKLDTVILNLVIFPVEANLFSNIYLMNFAEFTLKLHNNAEILVKALHISPFWDPVTGWSPIMTLKLALVFDKEVAWFEFFKLTD